MWITSKSAAFLEKKGQWNTSINHPNITVDSDKNWLMNHKDISSAFLSVNFEEQKKALKIDNESVKFAE